MKTLIVYYSYSGHTKSIAAELAIKESADITEIKDVKRPSIIKAITAGCFVAMRGKAWPIRPFVVDLTVYDRLILLAPIWASNPPPAFNALLGQLPEGKIVVLKMISTSGKSACRERIEAAIAAKNCTLESFEDIKAKPV